MFSFAQMLMAPAPKPMFEEKTHHDKGGVAGLNNAAFQNAVKRYGNVMRGQGPLSSPTIASRLGCPSSSSIMKTLIRFAQLGIIEDCGREKHIGHGKPPRLWRWIKD